MKISLENIRNKGRNEKKVSFKQNFAVKPLKGRQVEKELL